MQGERKRKERDLNKRKEGINDEGIKGNKAKDRERGDKRKERNMKKTWQRRQWKKWRKGHKYKEKGKERKINRRGSRGRKWWQRWGNKTEQSKGHEKRGLKEGIGKELRMWTVKEIKERTQTWRGRREREQRNGRRVGRLKKEGKSKCKAEKGRRRKEKWKGERKERSF